MLYYGLTPLGVFHTIVSFLALGAGITSLFKYKKISLDNFVGRLYVVATIIVCLTGFGIFQHGGFGKPHVLGVITLIVLAIAYAAGDKVKAFGKNSLYIEIVSYSMTFFFHIVPTITEGATRLPYGHPIASSPDDPRIQIVTGICLLLFIIGAVLQVRSLKAKLAHAK